MFLPHCMSWGHLPTDFSQSWYPAISSYMCGSYTECVGPGEHAFSVQVDLIDRWNWWPGTVWLSFHIWCLEVEWFGCWGRQHEVIGLGCGWDGPTDFTVWPCLPHHSVKFANWDQTLMLTDLVLLIKLQPPLPTSKSFHLEGKVMSNSLNLDIESVIKRVQRASLGHVKPS